MKKMKKGRRKKRSMKERKKNEGLEGEVKGKTMEARGGGTRAGGVEH